MGTSAAVMTARQSGKSIFGNKATHAWLDEWDTNASIEKPKVYLKFDDDPLALVIAMQRSGEDLPSIMNTLTDIGKRRTTIATLTVTAEDRAMAEVIYKHFRNKILMRRIKNQNLSKFMQAVDEVVEDRHKIEVDSLAPLIKLPDFYREDIDTAAIFNAHTSVPGSLRKELDCVIKYVGTVERSTQRFKGEFQYWATPSNHLVQVQLEKSNLASAGWRYIAQEGTVRIRTQHPFVTTIRGYDMNVVKLTANYEISKP
jgi:hypothetical protein